jgi:SAM-dependent methyltransferase
MANECKLCNSNRYVSIKCRIDANNIDKFKLFSKLKYNGNLDYFLNKGLDISISFCSKCKFYWYTNSPTDKELSKMYQDSNLINPINLKLKKNILTSKNELLLTRILCVYRSTYSSANFSKSKVRLLDFGSGTGDFSRIANQSGLDVTAYDPSLNRNTLKNDENIVYHDNVNDLPNDYFDIIILNQVLEHVPNPLETLSRINEIGNENVLIYIAVPNIETAPEGKNIWKDWPFNKNIHTMAPFEHLNGFTPRALEIAINKTGFEKVTFKNKVTFSIRYALVDELFNLFRFFGTTQILLTKQK